jgi:hypothetical protein
MLARQTGVSLAAPEDATLRLFRWLALRGSPPGNLDRPVNALLRLCWPAPARQSLLCPKLN